MYRKFLLASVGAIALIGSQAFAAEPLPYVPPPPVFTWTGPYIGGQIGGAWGTGNLNAALFDPVIRALVATSTSGTPSGVIGGAHVGYLYQINQWVLGIEGSVDGTGLRNTAAAAFPFAFGGSFLTGNTSLDILGTIRGKIGFAWDRVLIYGTGGAAFGGFSTDLSLVGTAPFFIARANPGTTRAGWTAGGGLQYAVTNNWSVFAEYRYTNLGSANFNNGFVATALPIGGFFNGSRQIRFNQVQAGFSYRFDLAPPVPVVAKY
jgi:outer membrane immunogenic protein